MGVKKLLLHVCCASCSTYVVDVLKKDYEITLYFNNPQIFPATEYAKRLVETKKIGEKLGIKVIEGNREQDNWVKHIEGLEGEPEGGKRCANCFEFNLDDTAKFAKFHHFDAFSTTLTLSPHKSAVMINEIGVRIGKENEIDFIEFDFKKVDASSKSCEICHNHDIYNHDYCGCEFSSRN